MISEADVASVMRTLPEHSFLRRYVRWGELSTDGNTCYHVAGALTLLAATAPMTLGARFGANIYPNIFCLIYGSSTYARKSTAVKLAQKMLNAVDPNLVGVEPGSPEGFVESVRINRRQVINYEEFGHFLAQAMEGYMRPIKTAFNIAIDCGNLSRALAKSKGTPVTDPRVSLFCACAPSLLEENAEHSDWTGGFLARFFVFAANRERYMPQPPGDPELEKELTDELRVKSQMPQAGQYMGMTPDALKAWTEWAMSVEKLGKDAPEEVLAAVGRAQQLTLKAALLLSWDFGEASTGKDWHLGKIEMEAALQFGNWHIDSALAIGGTLASNGDMRDRRRVLGAVDRIRPTPLGEILFKARILRRRAREILETLLEEKAIFAVTINGERAAGFLRRTLLPHEKMRYLPPEVMAKMTAAQQVELILKANVESNPGAPPAGTVPPPELTGSTPVDGPLATIIPIRPQLEAADPIGPSPLNEDGSVREERAPDYIPGAPELK